MPAKKQFIERKCLYCGKSFKINPKGHNGNKKYCSVACFQELNKKGKGCGLSKFYCNRKRNRTVFKPKNFDEDSVDMKHSMSWKGIYNKKQYDQMKEEMVLNGRK